MGHRDFSKLAKKGIGYIRTSDNVEIEFTPYAYDPTTSFLTKRMNIPVYYGMSPKLTIIDETHEYFSPKYKEALDELLKKEREKYMGYVNLDIATTCNIAKAVGFPHEIKDVIFNPPATIVYWKDGTKTVVKVQEGETFDPEKGLAMAFFKKMHGNTGNYNNVIHKWTKDYKPKYAYSSIWAEPEGLTIKADNLTNPLSDAASELKRIADALEKRYTEEKEPHNELTFGYPNEYSMEIDFPKDLTSEELDYIKKSIVSTSKFTVSATYSEREILKSSDAK